MASQPETVAFLLDQLAAGGAEVSARKMFGEYGLYLDGKMVALVCDDQLFVKETEAASPMLQGLDRAPPYPQAKPHPRVDGDRWDDAEWLGELFQVTASALPAPKVKRRKP